MQHHRSFAVVALFVGLGLAGYAVTQVQAVLAAASPIQEVPTSRVVTFATDLPQGHLITATDVTVVDFTTSSVPADAVPEDKAVGFYLERDVLAGDVAREPILSWEPIEAVPEPPQIVRVRKAGILELVTLP